MRISDWSSDVCSSDLERPTTASPHFNSSSAESALPPAATRTFFLPLRFARCAVGIIRWCLLWCTGIGLRPEFWLRLRRSDEHTSELQSLMRISYAVFCLKKKKYNYIILIPTTPIFYYYLPTTHIMKS